MSRVYGCEFRLKIAMETLNKVCMIKDEQFDNVMHVRIKDQQFVTNGNTWSTLTTFAKQ